jgi:hypothetical protein
MRKQFSPDKHSGVRNFYLLLLLFVIHAGAAYSQQTTITGKVTDSETGESLPLVSILLKNTTTVTVSLIQPGTSCWASKEKADSVIFTAVGYYRRAYKIQPYTKNELNVRLKPEVINISEVKVNTG